MSSTRWSIVLVFATCAWSMACGGKDDSATSTPADAASETVATDSQATDSSTVDSGSSDDTAVAIDDAADGGCNALVNSASAVEVVAVASAVPTMTGGTIAPGTYRATKLEAFTGSGGTTGPTGQLFQETVALSATTIQIVYAEGPVDGGVKEPFHGTFSYTVGGNNLVLAPLCGFTDPTNEKYTATATELRVLLLNPKDTVATFTKVP